MILPSLLGFSLGAACCTEGIRQYMADEETKIKHRVKFAFERAGLFVKVKKDKSEWVDHPKFLELVKMENGWYFKYRLPVGITIDDIDKTRKIIESATCSELVAWTDGQILHMEIFTERIPNHIVFHDDMMTQGLSLFAGFGRRGKEIIDYAKLPNPHMLVGGASGMGKSNFLNLLIIQLLQNPHARLYMGDPKRMEFSAYKGHTKVEVEPARIIKMVHGVQKLMQDRERFMEQEGFKSILRYNQLNPEKQIPYNFLIIDEIADFPADDTDFWEPVIEIGRKGRATGNYLVLATQRPSADVFPPTLKANLGIKVAFRTATLSNSRVLIESDGAFKLPMRSGRAIYNVGFEREIQIPEVKENQIHTILERLRRNESEGTD